MPIVSVDKDPQNLTMTFVAEFDASVDRVWKVWTDPRELERWWGPPGWPATFTALDFTEGGEARYYMTGPDGERSSGWWEFTSIDAPRSMEWIDGFADDAGEPLRDSMVTQMSIALEDLGGRTRVTSVGTFSDADDYEKLLAMGMEDGMRLAVGQIDAVLAD